MYSRDLRSDEHDLYDIVYGNRYYPEFLRGTSDRGNEAEEDSDSGLEANDVAKRSYSQWRKNGKRAYRDWRKGKRAISR